MRKLNYNEILLTILTICAVSYVTMDIYKFKRRNKEPQQINIENVLDGQQVQYETEEDMNKFRDIIFNLDTSLQKIEARLDLLETKKEVKEEVVVEEVP